MLNSALIFVLCLLPGVLLAQLPSPPYPAPLPPDIPWHGASERLILPPTDPWVTPSAGSNLSRTPSYAATVAWLRKLDAASPDVSLVSIGRSAEGREIWMAVISREKKLAQTGHSSKPLLLIQAGIHSGEIDGKDAGLMLIRDLTVRGTSRKLLDGANLLFIPILNVDGHERSSIYNRINQKGPVEMGWRANGRFLNLNRDYGKLDTPEIQAVVKVMNRWQPDIYVDLHVSDGIDYQYDVTFGYNLKNAYSPAIAQWLESELRPAVSADLERMGHIPGPLVFAVDNRDASKGIQAGPSSLRFSHGYGDVCHVPTVLVENHSLKPYRQRVLGTYVLVESLMRVLAEKGEKLREAVRIDRGSRPPTIPISWESVPNPDRLIPFRGVASRVTDSPISGGKRVEWTGEKQEIMVPYFESAKPLASAQRPLAYWVPSAWEEIIERLELHGLKVELLSEPHEVTVDSWRINGYDLQKTAYEGRVPVRATTTIERRSVRYPSGSVRVSTDQPLGDLAILLLEPDSPESFFQWSFFLSVLQEHEYAEGYVLEPLAEKMLSQDARLKAEFEKKLVEEPEFRNSPRRRLYWFYERSPFFENQKRYYPVGRECQ